jgi:hypothetical protein
MPQLYFLVCVSASIQLSDMTPPNSVITILSAWNLCLPKLFRHLLCSFYIHTIVYTMGPIRKNIDSKVKLSLCWTNYALHHEDVWGSGCIDPHFLDLGTSRRSVTVVLVKSAKSICLMVRSWLAPQFLTYAYQTLILRTWYFNLQCDFQECIRVRIQEQSTFFHSAYYLGLWNNFHKLHIAPQWLVYRTLGGIHFYKSPLTYHFQ